MKQAEEWVLEDEKSLTHSEVWEIDINLFENQKVRTSATLERVVAIGCGWGIEDRWTWVQKCIEN